MNKTNPRNPTFSILILTELKHSEALSETIGGVMAAVRSLEEGTNWWADASVSTFSATPELLDGNDATIFVSSNEPDLSVGRKKARKDNLDGILAELFPELKIDVRFNYHAASHTFESCYVYDSAPMTKENLIAHIREQSLFRGLIKNPLREVFDGLSDDGRQRFRHFLVLNADSDAAKSDEILSWILPSKSPV